MVHQQRTATQVVLIHHLNPLIRGWAAYYSTAAAKRAMVRMDFHTFIKLKALGETTPPPQALGVDCQQVLAPRAGLLDLREPTRRLAPSS